MHWKTRSWCRRWGWRRAGGKKRWKWWGRAAADMQGSHRYWAPLRKLVCFHLQVFFEEKGVSECPRCFLVIELWPLWSQPQDVSRWVSIYKDEVLIQYKYKGLFFSSVSEGMRNSNSLKGCTWIKLFLNSKNAHLILISKNWEQWIISQHLRKAMVIHFHKFYMCHLVTPCQLQILLFSPHPFCIPATYSLMHCVLTLKGLKTFQSRHHVFLYV